ncbi:unnamed protein product, partial [Durusdinium trenchii]
DADGAYEAFKAAHHGLSAEEPQEEDSQGMLQNEDLEEDLHSGEEEEEGFSTDELVEELEEQLQPTDSVEQVFLEWYSAYEKLENAAPVKKGSGLSDCSTQASLSSPAPYLEASAWDGGEWWQWLNEGQKESSGCEAKDPAKIIPTVFRKICALQLFSGARQVQKSRHARLQEDNPTPIGHWIPPGWEEQPEPAQLPVPHPKKPVEEVAEAGDQKALRSPTLTEDEMRTATTLADYFKSDDEEDPGVERLLRLQGRKMNNMLSAGCRRLLPARRTACPKESWRLLILPTRRPSLGARTIISITNQVAAAAVASVCRTERKSQYTAPPAGWRVSEASLISSAFSKGEGKTLLAMPRLACSI